MVVSKSVPPPEMYNVGTLKKAKCTSVLEVAFRTTYLNENQSEVIHRTIVVHNVFIGLRTMVDSGGEQVVFWS